MTLDACAALVERGDPDRFAAVMAAPVRARPVLVVLYAFNLEVARAPWVTKEPMIAEMRLQWWRDVLAEAVAGKRRAHEVAGPLADLVAARGLDVAVLDRLVEARRWDVYTDPFEDAAAFDAYLEDTAAGLTVAVARALGAGQTEAEAEAEAEALRGFGWAAGLAGFLRAVPDLEARGRVPLVDGRADAVAALARDGLVRLAAARPALRRLPRDVRPALIAGWQAEGLLRQVVADPRCVSEARMGLSEFARRFGLLKAGLFGRV